MRPKGEKTMAKKSAYMVKEKRFRNGLITTAVIRCEANADARDGERVQYANDYNDEGYLWEESLYYFKTHNAARRYVAEMYYTFPALCK